MSDEAEAREFSARRQRKLRRWAIVGLVVVGIGIAAGIVVATWFRPSAITTRSPDAKH